MNIMLVACLGIALVGTPAMAQSSAGKTIILKQSGGADACSALSSQIDKEQRLMALETALGEGDDSAPRDQVRSTKRVAHLLQIQIAMGQMAALKCAPYGDPIVDSRFATAAGQCSMALRSTTTPKGYGLPQSCRVADWIPD